MRPEEFQRLFDNAVGSSSSWLDTAGELMSSAFRILRSAESIRPVAQALVQPVDGHAWLKSEELQPLRDYQEFRVGIYLVALSIENMLKAIWVMNHQEEIDQVADLGKDLDGFAVHRLASLARESAMRLSSKEESLLDALTDWIMWYGRYPTPKQSSEFDRSFSTGWPLKRLLTGPSIFDIELPLPKEIDEFLGRLLRELKLLPEEK